MLRLIEFSVPGQPQGKGRARVSTHGGFARAYTPEKTAAYENLIKLSCVDRMKDLHPLKGAIKISITAFYAMPKAFSRKKCKSALLGEIRPQTKPDLDNIVKVVCDALNKIAYADDKDIVEVHARKYYDLTPRIEVIMTSDEEGLE